MNAGMTNGNASRDPDFLGLELFLLQLEEAAADRQRVTLAMLLKVAGERSFGPMLLIIGLILVSPLSGIPGMATTMAVLVMLTALQLLLGRRTFWLPRWLLRRSLSRARFLKALARLRPAARRIDRWLRPRLTILVGRRGSLVAAAMCLLIAVVMPVMELLPFSATIAGLALTVFGLSLLAQDGLLALAALALTAFLFGLIPHRLFG